MRLSEQISVLGDRPFMVYSGSVFTYSDLGREIERGRGLLREMSVVGGQVVALTGPYHFASAAIFLALAGNRNIVASLVGSAESEISSRTGEAGVEWVVDLGEREEEGRELGVRSQESGDETGEGGKRSTFNAQRSTFKEGEGEAGAGNQEPRTPHPLVERLRRKGRAGLILFSSGSTGRAKAMLHDLDTLVESYAVGKPKELRVLAFMGLDHIGGVDTFFRAIASGSCLVVPEERSPEAVCRLIEDARVEVLPVTPSFLNLMLLSEAYQGRDLSSLKIIGFGAERMPGRVLQRLREVFPKVDFQQKFGTSETNAIRTVSKQSDPLWMKIADRNVEWKTVGGELWLKTPSRILGYLNEESDRLTADGWYRTGDLVDEDGEGFFQIVGRLETVINVGGEKVNPGEVEAVLRERPEVIDCRVFGEMNPLMGEVVGADIVAREDADKREVVRAVRKHCRKKLPSFKVPVKVRVVDRIELSDRFKKKI